MDRWVILHHVLDKRATACGADRPECSTTIDTMRWLFSLLPWLGSTFPHRGRGPWQCKWIQSCSGWPPLFYHHLLSWWEWFLPGWQEGSVVWSVRKWCEWYATASCSLGLNPDEHLGEALDVGALSTTTISTWKSTEADLEAQHTDDARFFVCMYRCDLIHNTSFHCNLFVKLTRSALM